MNYFKSLLFLLNHPVNRNNPTKTFIRIFIWKVNQIFVKKPILVNLTQGIVCKCYPDSSYGSMVVYTRLPEYYEMKFLINFLNLNSIFIDVGANIGVYSLLAASVIKNGKIFSFEVNRQALRRLRENILLNDFSKMVVVVDKAVSDRNGKAFFLPEKISELSRLLGEKEKSGKSISVQTTRLDSFLRSKNIGFVDLVKIDVEGAEGKVLKGLGIYLKKGQIGVLIVEINSNQRFFGDKPRDIINFFNKCNYEVFIFEDTGRLVKINRKDYVSRRKNLNIIAVHNTKILQVKKITQELIGRATAP